MVLIFISLGSYKYSAKRALVDDAAKATFISSAAETVRMSGPSTSLCALYCKKSESTCNTFLLDGTICHLGQMDANETAQIELASPAGANEMHLVHLVALEV